MRHVAPRSLLLAVFSLGLVSAVSAGQAPVANFTWSPNGPAPNQLVQFTDTTNPTPSSWSWTFGDPASGVSNTSTLQNPTHVFSAAGDYTVTLLVSGGSTSNQVVHVATGTGACQTGAGFLCLNNGRFQVSANWQKPTGESGAATAIKLTDDSGYFWFFDASNIEMVVKVLNGCGLNNAYWVFSAGLTNVQVNWLVTDTLTGATFLGTNNQGTAFVPVQETQAFPNSCP